MTTLPSYVDLSQLKELIQFSLREDIGEGDLTSLATISESTTASAILKAKETGIVAGLFVVEAVFHELDPSVHIEWCVKDGELLESGTVVGTIKGNARSVLMAERLALNFLQRMSGIATLTREMVDVLGNGKTKLLDTRKTAPGLRMTDKWAVLLGGGWNHRVGLFDMMLIKENHIAAAGGIESALTKAVESKPKSVKIEIEVTNMDELRRVLAHGGADRVMLDNFVVLHPDGRVDTSLLTEALTLIQGRVETEASGNVTLATLGAIGKTGVDYISSGALTHSVRAMDFSLLVTIDS